MRRTRDGNRGMQRLPYEKKIVLLLIRLVGWAKRWLYYFVIIPHTTICSLNFEEIKCKKKKFLSLSISLLFIHLLVKWHWKPIQKLSSSFVSFPSTSRLMDCRNSTHSLPRQTPLSFLGYPPDKWSISFNKRYNYLPETIGRFRNVCTSIVFIPFNYTEFDQQLNRLLEYPSQFESHHQGTRIQTYRNKTYLVLRTQGNNSTCVNSLKK